MAQIIVPYAELRGDDAALIDEYQVTNIHLVPTQFTRMLRLEEETKAKFDGSSLEICWHGGAPARLQSRSRDSSGGDRESPNIMAVPKVRPSA